MSWAEIVSGGTDGRYTIKLDWGEARKTQMLAQVAAAIVDLQAKIIEQQQEIAKADAAEAAAGAALQTLQDHLILTMPDDVAAGGTVTAAKKLYDELLRRFRNLVLQHQPVRDALATLKAQLAQARAMAAYWNNFQATETRPAWCCDLTENATGYVATVDIPGDSNLMLIAPGGRGWQPGDGVLTAREIMSPAQAYWNAAVFPGWQKHRPTYRWGTLDAIDNGTGKGKVTLHDARSSAQRLGINQAATLNDVPFEYMTCHHRAFKEGDRVVVKFEGQDWASPRIIGFLDNPRRCPMQFAGMFLFGVPDYMYAFFTSSQEEADLMMTAPLTIEGRVDRGPWLTMHKLSAAGTDVEDTVDRRYRMRQWMRGDANNEEPPGNGQFDIQLLSGSSLTVLSGYPSTVPSDARGAILARTQPTVPRPLPGGDLPTDHGMVEFRILLGGALFANFAIGAFGYLGNSNTEGRIKNMGGYKPLGYWGGMPFVIEDGYVLDSESP